MPTKVQIDEKFAKNLGAENLIDLKNKISTQIQKDLNNTLNSVTKKEIMGNLIESTLDDIWRNDKYKEFRSKVSNYLNEPDSEPELCKSCLRWK